MAHFVAQCKHGSIVSQCRCPSKDKEVRIVPCPENCSMAGAVECVPCSPTPDPKATPAKEWPLTAEQIVAIEKTVHALVLTDGFKILAYPGLVSLLHERDEKIATLEREQGQAHDHIRELMARIKELESR